MSRDSAAALIGHLSKLLAPLGNLDAAMLRRLGLPIDQAQAAQITPTLETIRAATGSLIFTALELDTAIEADNTGLSISITADVGQKVADLISAFDQLQSAIGGLNLPGAGSIVAELPERLLHLLLAEYTGRTAGLNAALQLLGILERVDHNVLDPELPFYTVDTFHFDRIGGWLGDPKAQLQAEYGFGTGAFDIDKLLDVVGHIAGSLGLPVLPSSPGNPPRLDLFFAALEPTTGVSPPGLSLELGSALTSGILEWSGPSWTWKLELGMKVPAGTELVLAPWQMSVNVPGTGSITGEAAAEYAYTRSANDPLALLTLPGGSGVTVEGVSTKIGLRVDGGGQITPTLATALSGGRVSLGMDEADGFIGSLLGGAKLESNFDLGILYSADEGLHFSGSSTLEIQLASHIQLGPLEINALALSLGFDDGTFPLGVTADLKALLGPVVGVVEGIGLAAKLELRPDADGNLGPLDLAPAFIPPKGIGLAVDAGIVRGGGYLYFDPEGEEYAGALELAFAGIVTIKAIGLLTTRLPDGKEGFSLLLILSAEFGTGIQLGFGFVLLGVGGLVGLNRTMNLEALMEGVRTGAIESIMFPKDVIANAPKIISDLRGLFPPKEDTFLIGPMAKLGWGTPSLVSVSLGLVIEIPGNIAIVGILKIAIPADELALIVLQVNFAGAIEFDKKRLYFFAALFESRVIFLTLEGEMGLLVAFGDDGNFVVSVGGFHPRFEPPPLPFPSPKRIAINILNTAVARIRVEGYFAVTSNTAQFGARVQVFFGFDILNVKGHLAFDALFQFSPFFFVISISASLSVNVFGAGLFSVHISGELEGPSNWHIKGHGSLTILLWEISVDINESWGESKDTKLPPIRVLPLLLEELEKVENWRAAPPPSSHIAVSLRQLSEDDGLVLHPLGALRISQRAIPLDLKLDKVGQRAPEDVDRVKIKVAGGLRKEADVYEPFAPAQFKNFSDADRVREPAFAPHLSGMELLPEGEELRSSLAIKRSVRFEEILIDNNFKRFFRRFRRMSARLFDFLTRGSAASRSQLSMANQKLVDPLEEKIEVQEETYVVAFVANNQVVATEAAFTSLAAAEEDLARRLLDDASLHEELHVIPSFEKAA